MIFIYYTKDDHISSLVLIYLFNHDIDPIVVVHI